MYKLYEKAVYERPNQRMIENDATSLIRQRQSPRRMMAHANHITSSSTVAGEEENPSVRSVNSVRRRRDETTLFDDARQFKFYERSPDFCREPSYLRRIENRVCLAHVTQEQAAKGLKSCDRVCCRGRGWRWVKRKISKNCKFEYCCKVVCDEEMKWQKEFYCL